MKSNKGAIITGSRNLQSLVEVRDTPYPKLENDMIIVKAVAHAVNPTDWKHIFPEVFVSHLSSEFLRKFGLGIRLFERPMRSIGSSLGFFFGKSFTFLAQRGKVLGSDVSGIVEEVGKDVSNFRKGDIVSASLHGGISKNGGFAKYVMVSQNAAIKFSPSQILKEPLSPGEYEGTIVDSFEAAASVPVGLKTVALSFHHNLAISPDKNENTEDYILIWGGATATGILAIQIAKLIYGVKVITTASKRNHGTLTELGADEVFDYNDNEIIQKLKQAGKGRIKYALDCVSSVNTFQSVYDATEGSENVTIDNLLFLNKKSINTNSKRNVKFTNTDGYIVDGRVHFGNKASPEMMEKFLEFWKNYLPIVIENVKTAPLKVLPMGMESANEGLCLLIENKVGGMKVVFRSNED